MTILFAFLILAGLGVILGIGLAIADSKLAVKNDPKLDELQGMMPGANCGGCGFAGCSNYAEAVFKGEAQPGLCAPGGKDLAVKMAKIMGVEAVEQERMAAFVFCKGNCDKTVKEFDYKGIKDCNAASLFFKGDNGCKAGCLHMGSCISVCEFGAISKNENGEIVVDRDKCTGCGKCTKVCPNGVIKLIPYSAKFAVACNSHENGAKVRKVCEAGCIGCKICETKFPDAGFKVDNFLAVSDYKSSEEESRKAAEACPRKIITEIN